MSTIRTFEHSHVPAVADLFMKVFRPQQAPAPDSLKHYFARLYFDHPDDGRPTPSFVTTAEDGSVTGFIGAHPRTMLLNGVEIAVTVAGNHMVDPDQRDPFAGPNLLKRVLDGPQVLTLTDTANEVSRRLWGRLGAVLLPQYSMRWWRILQPAAFPLSLVKQRFVREAGTFLLRPFSSLVGRISRDLIPPPDQEAAGSLRESEFEPEMLISAYKEFEGPAKLQPWYRNPQASWILGMAAEKKEFGPLRKRALYAQDRLIGWYMYYARRGQTAEVLQLVAAHNCVGHVLNHLLVRAADEGCVAVSGLFHPRHIDDYHKQRFMILLRNMYTMAHSKNNEALSALLTGQASFSRLDGEWWTRLQGDSFAE